MHCVNCILDLRSILQGISQATLRHGCRVQHRLVIAILVLFALVIVIRRSVVDLNGVGVQSGNSSQIGGVQDGSVLSHSWFMGESNETGVAVRNIDDGSSQRKRVENIGGVLDGTDMNGCDAGKHLASDVGLDGKWDVTQVKVATVRMSVEEGEVDSLVTSGIMISKLKSVSSCHPNIKILLTSIRRSSCHRH